MAPHSSRTAIADFTYSNNIATLSEYVSLLSLNANVTLFPCRQVVFKDESGKLMCHTAAVPPSDRPQHAQIHQMAPLSGGRLLILLDASGGTIFCMYGPDGTFLRKICEANTHRFPRACLEPTTDTLFLIATNLMFRLALDSEELTPIVGQGVQAPYSVKQLLEYDGVGEGVLKDLTEIHGALIYDSCGDRMLSKSINEDNLVAIGGVVASLQELAFHVCVFSGKIKELPPERISQLTPVNGLPTSHCCSVLPSEDVLKAMNDLESPRAYLLRVSIHYVVGGAYPRLQTDTRTAALGPT